MIQKFDIGKFFFLDWVFIPFTEISDAFYELLAISPENYRILTFLYNYLYLHFICIQWNYLNKNVTTEKKL
jgi:hypothetical protein